MKKRFIAIILSVTVILSCISVVFFNASAERSFDYEIIQDFSDGKTYTRNSMWSRGMLTTSTNPKTNNDGAADIYQFDAADVSAGKDKLNGTPALSLRVTSDGNGWGATHLINSSLPGAGISNMSGIFFRFKTDTKTSTALSVTTVGKGTVATGSKNTSTNPQGTLLTDADKNDNNNCGNAGALLDKYSITKNSTNIRYYSTSGELIATGREVPAGFDGYVFIEVKNFDSYTKDGLTINWIDSDYKYAKECTSIGDNAHKWCVNGTLTKAIIDDVGYYAMSAVSDDNYISIIKDIEKPAEADYYEYEIIQDFSVGSTYTRNSMWSRGMLTETKNTDIGATDGATSIYQLDNADVTAGRDKLNGTKALALRTTSAGRGWGATHLINNSLPASTLETMSGIFFRMKTDTATSTPLSVTTVGKGTVATGSMNISTNPNGTLLTDADKNDNNNCGNAGALLDKYSITKNSANIRYYSVSGELIGTGREVPAGFDGYVFIEVKNFDSYTKDGLTINWIDSDYKYAKEYTSIGDTNHKWCVNGKYTSVIIDNVGYYGVGKIIDVNYAAIIDGVEHPKEDDGDDEQTGDENYNDYEIIQKFNSSKTYTRNSMWSRGMLTETKNTDVGATDGATNIYQLAGEEIEKGNDKLNGTPALALRMTSAGKGWGATHLINDALPVSTLSHMSGIFFRMKTDTTTSTPLSVTTVGKGTAATGSKNTSANPQGKLLTDDDKNNNNNCGNAGALLDEYSITKNSKNIRYYSTSGELLGKGREVPAGFDGYVFISVKDFDSYKKDGLTINWIDSDYKYAQDYTEIGDNAHKWCVNGKFTTAVIDDVGYYGVGKSKDANYAAIINSIENATDEEEDNTNYSSNKNYSDYEIIQKFNSNKTYTRNSMWSRGMLAETKNADVGATDGATNIYQLDASSVNAGKDKLNGTKALALRMTSAGKGWGATHLINDTLPDTTLDTMSGIFFRMKTDTATSTVLSVTTVGQKTSASGSKNTSTNPQGALLTDDDKNDNNDCGNAGALLDEYSITKNSTNIRYYSANGVLLGKGRAVPAGFDGYVFIGISDFGIYKKDGLTINWIDSDYKYAQEYTTIGDNAHKWCVNGKFTTVIIDDVGYFGIGSPDDSNYANIIGSVEKFKKEKEYEYQIINTFETESEKNVGYHYCGEAYITQANALSGSNSLATSVIANDWAMYTLEDEPPKPDIEDALGFFVRLKVDNTNNPAGPGSRQLFASTGDEKTGTREWSGPYTHYWGKEHGKAVFVWLDGKVERSVNVPDNFNGYAFIIGDTSLSDMYSEQHLKSLRIGLPAWGAWEDTPLKWKGSDLIFDNIGYFTVSNFTNDNAFKNLAAELNDKFKVTAFPKGYIPKMVTYITFEDDSVPAVSGASNYSFKPHLYFHTEVPVAVKWSIVKGKARIKDLDDSNDGTLKVHGAQIEFSTAGKVVVRCSIRDDKSQYSDYTFLVSKDSSKLNDAIFNTSLVAESAEGNWKSALYEAIEAAYKVLYDLDVTQETYAAYTDFLNNLVAKYQKGEPAPCVQKELKLIEQEQKLVKPEKQRRKKKIVKRIEYTESYLWYIIGAIAAVVIIAGAVVTLIIIKRKKKGGFKK